MSATSDPKPDNYQYKSRSAKECHFELMEWAKDARLYSEAIVRFANQVSESPQSFMISKQAWPLSGMDKFRIPEQGIKSHLNKLLKKSWRSQFILLEGIWEIYLERLYVELSKVLPEALEELCRQSPPDFLLQSILTACPPNLDDIRMRIAEWLASNLTRKSWAEQWVELQRLKIGLSEKQKKEKWWEKLDIYFEMRNCLVHRDGRPSDQLLAKDPSIRNQLDENGSIRLDPNQLQFFLIQFQNVITAIDKSLAGRLRALQQ